MSGRVFILVVIFSAACLVALAVLHVSAVMQSEIVNALKGGF